MHRWLLALAVLVLLAGCDLTGTHDRRDPQPPEPDTIGVEVTKVTSDQGHVVLTVLVPAGDRACAGRPQAVVKSYDAQQVLVDAVVDTDVSASCPKKTSRTFRTDLDLQGRQLSVNGVRYRLASDGSAATACDDSLGCDPPADRCDPAWTRRVTPHYDLPPAKHTTVVSCHHHWLILDVTATAASGAVQHRRWFAVLDPQKRWLVVASTRTGGCVDVRLAVPNFPLDYCRDLKPPGASQPVCRLRWATSSTQRNDLPASEDVNVISCRKPWLVADVRTPTLVRWFARLDDQGRWEVVATSRGAGCRDVLRAVPSFPKARCEGLPALT